MKTLVLFLALIVVGVLTSTPAAGSKDFAGRKQKGTIQFNEPVILHGVTLKGEFLFVHDDTAMTRGEACTRVYRGAAEIANKLVAEFHCVPVQRTRSDHFIVRSKQVAPDTVLITEYQFKGDTEGHAVP